MKPNRFAPSLKPPGTPPEGIHNWRELFKQRPITRDLPQGEIPVYIVLKPSVKQPDCLDLSFYQMGTGTNQLRKLKLPRAGPLQNVPEHATLFLKTLDNLSQSERNPYQHRHTYLAEPTARTIKASRLSVVLKELFDQFGTFLSEADMLGFLKTKSLKYALNYTEFQPPRYEVRQTETGDFELDAKVELDGESVSFSQLRPFAGLTTILHYKNALGPFIASSTTQGTSQTSWLRSVADGPITITAEDLDGFLETAINQDLPLTLPENLRWPEITASPEYKVQLRPMRKLRGGGIEMYAFDLRLTYGVRTISYSAPSRKIVSATERQVYVRDLAAEDRLRRTLPIDLLISSRKTRTSLVLPTKNLQGFIRRTLALGFPIELDTKAIQTAGDFSFSVSSGVDWFDVQAQAGFAGQWLEFPAILEALKKGENFVALGNDAVAFLDESVIKKIEKLTAFGDLTKTGVRFQQAQGFILNSLLESEPQTKFDEAFERLREKIKSFSQIEKKEPPETFKGELRDYQKEGLGWLQFLTDFGLGGILADDMGLGKTIQCLAFLEQRRLTGQGRLTNLLLAPKSLLGNWQSEAELFTPNLKVLVFAGSDRQTVQSKFQDYDLVVMTYQTMLRDFETLKDYPWDCVILDEAQAIKNTGALVSKAVKRLPAQFRLAMTGTPIENSVQDLFSISDFVNPGFMRGTHRSVHLNLNEEARSSLSRAFKPIILRRTKAQVLKDLPPKTETIITVELEDAQLKIYNQLKRFYQSTLLKEIDANGVGKSSIQVLAALTRLRQAALHPALIDPSYGGMESAKFIAALEMLEDIVAEGHRVLIFSQFTSLLSLFKTQLNEKKFAFSYLDGKTKNRKAVIDDFKQGTNPVFLISLKAGGVGLNLVEADYVFLLDPWWNPSTEAQAIDRVHRIGQKQAVNAYRFIAKGTVEEKILELQKLKKQVSSEMLDDSSTLMRTLSAQDIQGMFS